MDAPVVSFCALGACALAACLARGRAPLILVAFDLFANHGACLTTPRAAMKPLLQRIEHGEIDPTRVITHTLPLEQAPRGYDMFKNKEDNCEKVVLKPGNA